MMLSELKQGSHETISEFMTSCESDFSSAQAVEGFNVQDYARKLDRNAVVLVCKSQSQAIDGMIAFYCNDMNSRRAHVAYFAIAPQCRGSGLADDLMDGCASYCMSVGMRSVTAESWRGKPWVRFLSRWAKSRNHATGVPEKSPSGESMRLEIFFRGA